MTYGLFTIPLVFAVSGPLGLLGSCLFAPGLAALSSVMMGDYLSGDRHPFLIALATSYGTMWAIGLVTAIANVAVGTLTFFLAYSLYSAGADNLRAVQTREGGLGAASRDDFEGFVSLIRNGAPAPLALIGVLGLINLAAFGALTLAPPLVTTLAMGFLRKESPEDSKLPRLVLHRRSTDAGVRLGTRR
jgi:hypothetical protein